MKPKILAIAAAVILLLAFNVFFPLEDYLLTAVAWFQHLGPISAVLYLLLYTACSVFFVPISPLMMVAGTIYGFWQGYLLAITSGLCGVALTYVLGKKLWRKRVEQMRIENPRFESIFEAISRRGILLVFLIRLNPFLPFTLLNYLFTVPKLDFRKYMLASLVGMTPDILFYIYVGKVGRGLLDHTARFTVWNGLALVFALAATALAAIIINNLVRKALPPRPETRGEARVPASSGV